MLTLIIRAILVYLIVLIVFRLMGKRQLGQMQPFELVLTLIIADLATIPMAESSVPILHGLVPLLTLVTVHFFLALATRNSDVLNTIISGKPVIVINPNGIDYKAIKSLNIAIDDLFEAIRGCGYFSFDEIQYAIVETNGTVHVLPKKESSPLTIGDLEDSVSGKNLKLEKLEQIDETTIPITIIAEGKINKNNLKLAKLSESELKNIIIESGEKNIKNILILTIDGNGKIYFQQKKGTFKTFNVNYTKEVV
ncbi:MAG: DUF421 domain-containing protein [Firmicutes bacterium]|nr:DUF421 domain-containing protein [Bacillota bacterium]